jgi:hypothetical protein
MSELELALPHVPKELVSMLEAEYREAEARFARGDWGPAELNGGRFAEATLRILEWRRTSTYTPIGVQVDRKRILREVEADSTLPEGMRFHVAKAADLLMDFRNKRNVAHLGANLNIDAMDSQLVMRLISWILAEIVREEGRVGAGEAQVLIDRLTSRRLPLVEEVGGDLRVVATNLDAATRALVALYRGYPRPLTVETIRKAVGYLNGSRFRALLAQKSKEGILHFKGDDVYLTGKGVAWVEKYVEMRLEV